MLLASLERKADRETLTKLFAEARKQEPHGVRARMVRLREFLARQRLAIEPQEQPERLPSQPGHALLQRLSLLPHMNGRPLVEMDFELLIDPQEQFLVLKVALLPAAAEEIKGFELHHLPDPAVEVAPGLVALPLVDEDEVRLLHGVLGKRPVAHEAVRVDGERLVVLEGGPQDLFLGQRFHQLPHLYPRGGAKDVAPSKKFFRRRSRNRTLRRYLRVPAGNAPGTGMSTFELVRRLLRPGRKESCRISDIFAGLARIRSWVRLWVRHRALLFLPVSFSFPTPARA